MKLQITLLHLGLCLIGKDALVMTGEPVGNGADGRFRCLVHCVAELCCDSPSNVVRWGGLILAASCICGLCFGSVHFSLPGIFMTLKFLKRI